MQRQPLAMIVQQFDCLNPFELDNLCEMLSLNFRDAAGKDSITLSDLCVGKVSGALVQTARQVLMRSAFTDLVFQFTHIGPHGLNRISRMLLLSLEEMQASQPPGTPLAIDRCSLMESLTDAMRRLKLELAKDRLEEVRTLVEEEYRSTGTPMPLAGLPDNIYRLRERRAQMAD